LYSIVHIFQAADAHANKRHVMPYPMRLDVRVYAFVHFSNRWFDIVSPKYGVGLSFRPMLSRDASHLISSHLLLFDIDTSPIPFFPNPFTSRHLSSHSHSHPPRPHTQTPPADPCPPSAPSCAPGPPPPYSCPDCTAPAAWRRRVARVRIAGIDLRGRRRRAKRKWMSRMKRWIRGCGIAEACGMCVRGRAGAVRGGRIGRGSAGSRGRGLQLAL
jgi:hypothetical protein